MAPTDYQTFVLPYAAPPERTAVTTPHRPVIVVGAGPVGLTVAIDLARYGTPVLLLDDDDKLSGGSRAICFSKRSLEIWDRLGCGEAITSRGVSWSVGKVYCGDRLVYQFDLLPEPGHHRPAFVNLQQYCAEGMLYEHALREPNVEMRFRHRVVGVEADERGVVATVETPDGTFRLHCDYLVACDGVRSSIRGMVGLEAHGQVFRDRFLIADVRMSGDFPTERRFWFDPPFHRGGSALMHRQPDNVWRLDFQLGWDADPIAERQPERVLPRVRAMVGEGVAFELVWCSVYTFACTRMERFRKGRVLFAGDAAHVVSPFGARGSNSGVEDAANLAWKLHYVLQGKAPDALLDSYCSERERAADENIRHSTRSADFLTPKSEASRLFRDAVLGLAREHPFARRLVNSGRLSTPSTCVDSPLNTRDVDRFEGALVPGAPPADAPVMHAGRPDWLLNHLGGRFVAMHYADTSAPACREALAAANGIRVDPLVVTRAMAGASSRALVDAQGLVASRYDARAGTTYLFRPDQHVCARWRTFDPAAIRAAVRRATAQE